jgi:streptogramin lyase
LAAVLAVTWLACAPAAVRADDGSLVITTASINSSNNLVLSLVDPEAGDCQSATVMLGTIKLSIVSQISTFSRSPRSSTSTIVAKLPVGMSTGAYAVDVKWADARDTVFEINLGVRGPDGAVGVQGPKGPVGPAGAAGPAGATGAIGPAGPVGSVGPAGNAGATGATGPAGPQGSAGAAGPVGPSGAQGPTGPAGPAGAVGLAGSTGPVGPLGPVGAIGATGPVGPSGPVGPQGATGPVGPVGAVGLPGIAGTQGAVGLAGPQGAVGPSGATGPDGPQGAAGATGPVGAAGPAGLQGPAGALEDLTDLSTQITAMQALVAQLQAVQASIVPGSPTSVTASASVGQASVSFAAPAPNNGNPPTGYTVTSTPGGITAAGTGSPILVSGLAAGISYTFTVTANNSGGSSAPSAASAPVTVTGVPAAPTVSGVSTSNGQAIVSFTSPANNGGLPIIRYTVTSFPGGITAYGTSSPLSIAGLTPGQSYTFTVTATNAAGNSAPSAVSSSVLVTALLGTPLITGVTASDGQVGVAFSPAGAGPPATSYTVTSSPGGIVATGSSSPIFVAGLTNRQTYTFTVTANSASGSSTPSAPSAASTPAVIPASHYSLLNASNGLALAVGSDGGIWYTGGAFTVARLDPVTHVSTGVTDSNVTAAWGIATGSDGALWLARYQPNSISRIDPVTHVVTNYSDPRISAPQWITAGPDGALWFTNSNGNSVGSIDPVSHAISIYSDPSIHSPQMITAGSDGAIWFANPGTNFIGRIDTKTHAITSYPTFFAGGGESYAPPYGITTGPDGAIWFTVGGIAAVGRMDPFTHVVTGYLVAGGKNFQGITTGSDGALWFVDGGSVGGGSIGRIDPTTHAINLYATGGRPIAIVSGPDGALWYSDNASGMAGRILPDSAPGTPTAASAPTLTGVRAGNGQATVSFNPSATDGGSPITHYTVTASPGGLTATGTAGPLTVSGLTPGQAYTFTVTAANGAGTSPSSPASYPVVEFQSPGSPTITGVAALPAAVSVSFTAPPDGGAPITFYTVTAFPGGNQVSGSSSPLVVSGLTIGQSYIFKVVANNSVGSGPPSAPSNPVKPAAVAPNAPNIAAASVAGSAALLTIDASTYDGGSPILYWTAITSPATSSGPVTSTSAVFAVPNLQPGTTYNITATATNAAGTSVPSAAVTVTAPAAASLVPGLVIVQVLPDSNLIDAVTGGFVLGDGSEADPLTFALTLPPPDMLPTYAYFYGDLLTLDPVSGRYTTFLSTTVDIATGAEYDPFGNYLDSIDLTQAYLVTTAGTIVSVLNLSVQLDPLTLAAISSNPYTVAATLPDYSVANGFFSAAYANE